MQKTGRPLRLSGSSIRFTRQVEWRNPVDLISTGKFKLWMMRGKMSMQPLTSKADGSQMVSFPISHLLGYETHD